MPTEKLTNFSELFPGQPILARRVDKKNAQEATLGVARRFANTAAASKRSTGSTYPPCACGPQNVVSPVSPGSKQCPFGARDLNPDSSLLGGQWDFAQTPGRPTVLIELPDVELGDAMFLNGFRP